MILKLFTHIPLSIDFSRSPVLSQDGGDLCNAIDRMLELIVFTPKGSFIADPEFGFEYWNHEFSNINIREFNNNYLGMVSNSGKVNEISRKRCEQSLKESILNYEPRLIQPEIRVELYANVRRNRRNLSSKYEMRIAVTGSIDDGLGVMMPYEKIISFMVEPIARNRSQNNSMSNQ